MGLADSLNAERERSIKGPACKVCALLGALPKDEADALRAALADFGFTGESISRALAAEGHQIQGQTIQRHRRGGCRGSV